LGFGSYKEIHFMMKKIYVIIIYHDLGGGEC
jgi:hypothetical protein